MLPLSGRIVACHPADGSLVLFDTTGEFVARVQTGLTEGHAFAPVVVDGEELLWVADCAIKIVPSETAEYGYELGPAAEGQVVLVRLDGVVVERLPDPSHERYESQPYRPTSVCVDDDGSVWVADGYGASLVHRYDADGQLDLTLDGFDCPHGLLLDRRRDEPELYVADRGNNRIVVHGTDGTFRRVVGEGVLDAPSALATHGDLLFVAELQARLTVLDADDALITHIGENKQVTSLPAWPNAIGADGKVARSPHLVTGLFNSPHGLTADEAGDVYVSEWLVGGRFVKLRRT